MEVERGADATHIACCDEAQYNVGRYRGLGAVTLPITRYTPLVAELADLIRRTGMAEVKWEKVRGARGRYAAIALLTWACDQADAGDLRVDTLTWDTSENPQGRRGEMRHIRRLQRLYAAFLGDALSARWGTDARWAVYPDAQDALDWSRVATEAASGGARIERITPRDSRAEPLIQLADLFAGLAVFSRAAYDDYERWLHQAAVEAEPAAEDALPERFSGSLRERLLVLDQFYLLAKTRALGLSLRSQRGLRSFAPAPPIRFAWLPPAE